MAEKKIKATSELKKYLKERGVSVSGYLKTSAVERMVLAVDPNE